MQRRKTKLYRVSLKIDQLINTEEEEEKAEKQHFLSPCVRVPNRVRVLSRAIRKKKKTAFCFHNASIIDTVVI